MAKIKGANAVLDVMYKWGIDHLYGFPGGSFDSTMNAIYEMQDKIQVHRSSSRRSRCLGCLSRIQAYWQAWCLHGFSWPWCHPLDERLVRR
jgi:hypothetical protein